MSDEIRVAFNLSVANGTFQDTIGRNDTIDQFTAGKGGYVQEIGTSEEVVNTGDVTTLGWCYMANLDDSNYVRYGPESSGAMVVLGRIPAGEFVWFRLEPGVTLRAQADTAAVKVDVRIYEGVGGY